MSEHIQYILTYIVVALAVIYVAYSVVSAMRRSAKGGCSDIGCPNCGASRNLKKNVKSR